MTLDGFVRCRCPRDVCPHEDRLLAVEEVGNWAAYRGFQHALSRIGWQHFPVLHAVLPRANDGTAPASTAPAALAELQSFTQHTDLGEQALLCDDDTGDVVWEQLHAFGGANVLVVSADDPTRDLVMGVDLDGFFVRRGDVHGGEELFRATTFGQEVIRRGDSPAVRFTDDTHSVTVARGPIRHPDPAHPHGPPVRLRTRSRRRTPDDFAPTVGALRRLLDASVETGNPVVWC